MSSTSNRSSQAQTTHVWRKLFVRILLIIAAVAAMAYLGGGTSEAGAAEAVRDNSVGTVDRIEEDDPRWDCRTMGNHVCGEGATVNGQPIPAGDYTHAAVIPVPEALDTSHWVSIDEGPDVAGTVALVLDGYLGVDGDGIEAIYVPLYTVANPPGGTVTVMPDGSWATCIDWQTTGAECTGREFLPAA
jgi:hypothetical protein